MSRKNKGGRVRCGKCFRVLWAAVRRQPRSAEIEALIPDDDAKLASVREAADEMARLDLYGFHQQDLRQTTITDDNGGIVGFYCPKCSIRYVVELTPEERGDGEHHDDLVLTAADIVKARRA